MINFNPNQYSSSSFNAIQARASMSQAQVMTTNNTAAYTGASTLNIPVSQYSAVNHSSAPSAPQSSSPFGLEVFGYGSLSPEQAQLLYQESDGKDYIAAYVPTPGEAKELVDAKIANVFNPAWQQQIAMAVERNGGLGNEVDGFLAFAQDGFVRLKNNNLSVEQNRVLAAISLQTGIHIEKLPARSTESISDPEINRWVDTFIQRYQTGMEQFLANPSAGFHIKDGRRNYVMQLDPQSGMVGSMYFKEHGGLRGWVQKNLGNIGEVLDGVSAFSSFIPGWGTVAAGVAQALKAGAGMIATGKAKFQDLLSLGSSLFSSVSSATKLMGAAATTANTSTSFLGGIGQSISDTFGGIGDWFKSILPEKDSIWGQTWDRGVAIASDIFNEGRVSGAHIGTALGTLKDLLFGNEQYEGILGGQKQPEVAAGA